MTHEPTTTTTAAPRPAAVDPVALTDKVSGAIRRALLAGRPVSREAREAGRRAYALYLRSLERRDEST